MRLVVGIHSETGSQVIRIRLAVAVSINPGRIHRYFRVQ